HELSARGPHVLGVCRVALPRERARVRARPAGARRAAASSRRSPRRHDATLPGVGDSRRGHQRSPLRDRRLRRRADLPLGLAGPRPVDAPAAPAQLLQREHGGRGLFSAHGGSSEPAAPRAHLADLYLCLCLGFQGQYAVYGSQGLAPIIEQLAGMVGAAAGSGEVVSPHGMPPERVRGGMRSETPVVGLSLSFLAVAIVIFIALKVTLTVRVWNIGRDLTTPIAAHTSTH